MKGKTIEKFQFSKVSIKKEKCHFKIIAYFIIVFFILLLYFSGPSFAKMMDEIRITSNAKIIEPILILDTKEAIFLSEENPKGIYEFKIKNYQDDKISDVNLRYSIEIIPVMDSAIECHLYLDNTEILLEQQKTEYIDLQKDEKKEHQYRLEIAYHQERGNFGKDLLQNLQLKVHSEQQKG